MTERRHQTPTHMYSEDPEAVYPTPSIPPAPARMYSEYPEAVYPTPTVPPTPIHTMHTGAPAPYSEAKQYPYHPDSIGQTADYNAATGPYKEIYAGQPLTQQGPPHPHQYHTPYGHPRGYATAVSLHNVQSASCPVDCPVCGEREMTRIETVSGGTTHGWAAALFCCCLWCIPYLMSSLKDVEHSCGKCNAKLAVWHKSGHVQVLQIGMRK